MKSKPLKKEDVHKYTKLEFDSTKAERDGFFEVIELKPLKSAYNYAMKEMRKHRPEGTNQYDKGFELGMAFAIEILQKAFGRALE